MQREGPTIPLTDNDSGVDFGNVVQGANKTITFTLRNSGTQNLTGLALTAFGTHAKDFIISAPSVGILGAADTTTFTVTLRPSALGPRSAVLRIASNDATRQPFFRINVSGTGTAPELDITQSTLAMADGKSTVNFGTTVAVGESVIRSFTLTNSGTTDLTFSNLVVDGLHASEFQSGVLPSSLAPGQSAEYSVTFTPTSFGPRTAALHIISNDANESPFDIKLLGTAIGSEISIEQPVKVLLVSQTSSIDFGAVTTGSTAVRTFTLKNLGNAPLSGLALSSDSPRFAVSVLPDTLAVKGTTTFTVTYTPDAVAVHSGGITITSNDNDETNFVIGITGQGIEAAPPTITPDPQSQIIALGQPVTFSATVSSPVAMTQQWRKITGSAIAVIKGATVPTFSIPAVKLIDAKSLYQILATQTTGGQFAESASAALTVVDRKASLVNLAAGATATFTIVAAGSSELTYEWRKDGEPLPDELIYEISATNALIISSLKAADAGTYTCQVTGPGGTLSGGANVLTVFSAAPVITPNPLVLPPAIIAGSYSFFIPLDPAQGTATSFTSTKLPAGLALNTTTGEISGKPTISQAAPYAFTITAKNAIGSSIAPATLLVSPLTPDAAGSYIGIIPRGPVTQGLGGRIDLTITPTGSYTGKITLGADKAITFPAGSITSSLDSDLVTGTILVPRPKLDPVTVSFVIDTLTRRFTLSDCTVTIGADSSPFTGWRNVWTATAQAANYRGYYTFAIDVPVEFESINYIPQGLGFGSLTVPVNGAAFPLAGKLADGDSYTSSAFIGPDGDLAVFSTLPSKGTLVGTLQVSLGTGPAYTDNALTGSTLTWSRPASIPTKVNLYKDGFDPIPLTVEGGRYIAPVAPAIVMNKIAGPNNARLAFFDARITGPPSPADRYLTLTSSASLTLPATGPTLTSLKVASATGIFSGGFTLLDSHPFLFGAAPIKRTSTFQGLIIPTSSGQIGQGYFLLQQLPTDIYPAPTVLPTLSGGVIIE
ncbi:uncharacterized protein DUF1573 [Prosthecobacter fusiformis]|uniref:Uncharacterized protein DUF1573 n=1 Tax=Prosthecobacter fusiformis TaxID=48464 RepID=A0A4V3FI60_9BACT|nr:choice-of-anchor D domain-containing protein [Prosthecobacter fusiformis]TDU81203.1 uncharacterized protein DUF1573 [Prosthecobacter fusiformis]